MRKFAKRKICGGGTHHARLFTHQIGKMALYPFHQKLAYLFPPPPPPTCVSGGWESCPPHHQNFVKGNPGFDIILLKISKKYGIVKISWSNYSSFCSF